MNDNKENGIVFPLSTMLLMGAIATTGCQHNRVPPMQMGNDISTANQTSINTSSMIPGGFFLAAPRYRGLIRYSELNAALPPAPWLEEKVHPLVLDKSQLVLEDAINKLVKDSEELEKWWQEEVIRLVQEVTARLEDLQQVHSALHSIKNNSSAVSSNTDKYLMQEEKIREVIGYWTSSYFINSFRSAANFAYRVKRTTVEIGQWLEPSFKEHIKREQSSDQAKWDGAYYRCAGISYTQG